ncbi:MAG: CRISPR system precrRNA processing endoribonuclease RAMP protein Cas6 [Pseudomonadota bacterium]|nr:CRISPR system precrRNA processing endoribonuclease RAMP protein Cas6 [Pseudomonadota bacterium]
MFIEPCTATAMLSAAAEPTPPQPPWPPALTLPSTRTRLTLRMQAPVRLPDYAGSAWRGVLGHALRRHYCVTGLSACPPCPIYRRCRYVYQFETPPDPDGSKLRRYTAAPHPFVIEPLPGARELAAGDTTGFSLLLIGQAQRHLPDWVQAAAAAGRRGLGPDQAPFEVQDASSDEGVEAALVPTHTQAATDTDCDIRIELLTPLRLYQARRLVGPAEFSFGAFFSTLLRRISLLSHFHTATPLEMDFRAAVAAGRAVQLADSALRWHDWSRASTRQRRRIPMGGLIGSFTARRVPVGMLPLLRVGERVHVGKGASMGLGRYRLGS